VEKTRISTDPAEAASALRRGELVAIPTETVYGLAGHGLRPETLARIFAVKKRPSFDPLILHLASPEQLDDLACNVPPLARTLASAFWPGPLTLVLPRRSIVPDLATSGLDTVALRVPDHPLTRELLGLLDFPLAAPSANPFGYISPTTAAHVMDQLGGAIPLILDGGPCRVGLESSIVGLEQGRPVLYRLGGLSRERLESVTGPLELALNRSGNPRAPGQLKSHYAPRTPLRLLGPGERPSELHPAGLPRSGYLAYREAPPGSWGAVRVLSPTGNTEEAARNLFGMLRELDALGLELILAERLPQAGLGAAINDRLERAEHRD
jgi:L-threonylcarbamoyladenylate synthase